MGWLISVPQAIISWSTWWGVRETTFKMAGKLVLASRGSSAEDVDQDLSSSPQYLSIPKLGHSQSMVSGF